MNNSIYLPYNFKPYPYQSIIGQAFHSNRYHFFINVWHRRAGKDTTWFELTLEAACKRVGYYLYLLPTIGEAKEVIWEGIGADGKRFLDFIPPKLLHSLNKVDMHIKLINGSLIKIGGTEHYNAHMGTNPVGIVLSEYSLQNPLAWEFLMPTIAENKGWVAFVYTFRGNNHGYELYEQNKDNPDFFTTFYTVNDTKRHDGTPVVTEETINKFRKAGFSESHIQQEFYNIPTSMDGSYFAKEIMRMERENRLCDFAIDITLPVDTYWDLGYSDKTALWLVQNFRNEKRVIAYYENNFEKLNHYINWLYDFRNKTGIIFNKHYAPHDLSRGKLYMSLEDIARKLGIYFTIIPKTNDKISLIEATRMLFSRIWIHKTNCKHGIRCLKEYHATYNEKLNSYGSPCHNWASHGADAFMGIAQMNKEIMTKTNNIINRKAINTGSLF